MTATEKPYKLDANGFPVTDCPKCDGNGTIGRYNNHFHGICFRCNGIGGLYPTVAIRRHATTYAERLKEAMQVRGGTSISYNAETGDVTYQHSELTPGKVVRQEAYRYDEDGHRIPANPWRTVATYRRTAAVIGEGTAGPYRTWNLEGVVTYTDGTQDTVCSQNWQTQPPAELITEGEKLAAKCRASYERTLGQRAGHTGSTLDADTTRYVTAVRAVLSDDSTDSTDKLLALARLYEQKRTTTAARGVRDRVRRIHHESLAGWRSPTREDILTAIAAYINDLTGSTK